jgi:putative transposase
VLLKIVYLLTCRVLGLAVLALRGDRAKDAGLLVLRHQNAVLRRHGGRVRVRPGRPGVVRRAGTAPAAQALDRDLPRDAGDAPGLAPQARRQQVRHERAVQPGRPPTAPGVGRLVVRLAKENPLWDTAGSMPNWRSSA